MPFPDELDDFPDPQSGGPGVGSTMQQVPHAALHRSINAAVEALQAKVGVDGSDDPDSLEKRVTDLETGVGHTHVSGEVPTGTVNGVNVTFTLSQAPSPAAGLMLFLNGILQRPGGHDFTLASATVTFVEAPPSGSVLIAHYIV